MLQWNLGHDLSAFFKDPEQLNGSTLEDLLLGKTAHSNSQSTSLTLVIIDEAQKLYKPNSGFNWEYVKSHMQQNSRINHKLHIFFMAAYGESPRSTETYAGTPITFSSALGAGTLNLSFDEFKHMVGRYMATIAALYAPISESLADIIFNFTGGHMGLTVFTLESIHRKWFTHSTTRPPPNEKEISGYLLSGEYLNHFKHGTRAVPRRHEDQFSDQEKQVFEMLIKNTSYTAPDPRADDKKAAIDGLVHDGLLARDDHSQLCFPSPIIRFHVMNKIYPSDFSSGSNLTFDAFLIRVIQNFDPDVLANSLSKAKDSSRQKTKARALYERQMQMEFYRCAFNALGGEHYCFPDVGAVFGSSGFLDFYVDSKLQWAVELGCELSDTDLMEHVQRFGDKERYKLIPMQEKVVLHFCFANPNLKNAIKLAQPKDKLEWRVLVDSSEGLAIVRKWNSQDQKYTRDELPLKACSNVHIRKSVLEQSVKKKIKGSDQMQKDAMYKYFHRQEDGIGKEERSAQ